MDTENGFEHEDRFSLSSLWLSPRLVFYFVFNQNYYSENQSATLIFSLSFHRVLFVLNAEGKTCVTASSFWSFSSSS